MVQKGIEEVKRLSQFQFTELHHTDIKNDMQHSRTVGKAHAGHRNSKTDKCISRPTGGAQIICSPRLTNAKSVGDREKQLSVVFRREIAKIRSFQLNEFRTASFTEKFSVSFNPIDF